MHSDPLANCEKFKKFYYESSFSLAPSDFNRFGKSSITRSTIFMSLVYNFKAFKQEGFGEFNYRSSVKFQFGLKGYYAQSTQNEFSIEKPYGEQLDNDEINALVKAEMKAHQEMIENKIKELKKKQKISA